MRINYVHSLGSQTGEASNHFILKAKQAELIDIIGSVLQVVYNADTRVLPARGSHAQTTTCMVELNVRLCRWHNDLPSNLRWDQWGSLSGAVEPMVANIQYVRFRLWKMPL